MDPSVFKLEWHLFFSLSSALILLQYYSHHECEATGQTCFLEELKRAVDKQLLFVL